MTRRADPEGLTTFTRDVGGRTIVARCAPALAPEAARLLEAVAKRWPNGRGLAEGATVEAGWTRLRLIGVDGQLVLCEPDFEHGGHVSHVQHTLAVAAAQAQVLRRLRLEGDAPMHDATLVVRRGALTADRVQLERGEPAPGASGWYVGLPDEDPPTDADAFETLTVGDLVERRPALLALLALPPGYMAIVDGETVKAVLNPDFEDVWEET